LKSNNRTIHKELIEACKNGNRKMQYQLYALYADAMFAVCLRLLKKKEDAEDVLQESFVDAFKHLKKFKFDSSFGYWLKRIVINKSINHLNLKSIPMVDVDPQNTWVHEEEPEDSYFSLVTIDQVKNGMNALPDGYRTIMSLYLFEGYDHVEIGEILDISTSTSKSQYHRAKKRLLHQLSDI